MRNVVSKFLSLLAILLTLSVSLQAYAGATNGPTSTTNPISTVSTGFTATGQASITAGQTSSNVPLGSVGPTALVINTGTASAYVNFGGPGVTATTSSYLVPSGWAMTFNVGTGTYIGAITTSGTTTLSVTTGTGTPSLTGGGGGGGSGGAVSIADGSDIALGQKSDAVLANCANGYDGTQSASLICLFAKLVNQSGGSIPYGTNDIGKVWLEAGTNDIGKVDGPETAFAAITGGLTRTGCRAATGEPGTEATDGQAVDVACTKNGKVITSPYAPEELRGRGSTSASTTTQAFMSNWTVPAGLHAYITDLTCDREDASGAAIHATINDTSGFIVPLFATGGFTHAFLTPLKVSGAATSPAITLSGPTTSLPIYCEAEGYNAP